MFHSYYPPPPKKKRKGRESDKIQTWGRGAEGDRERVRGAAGQGGQDFAAS
jgi:hypothetical protein